MHFRILSATSIAAVAMSVLAPMAIAQGTQSPNAQSPGQNWFVPGQARGAAPRYTPAPGARNLAPRAPMPGPAGFDPTAGEPDPEPLPQLQVQLPPAPDIPVLPRAPSPPAAVIGVIAVPDVMRASSAAQQIERVIGERRQKLNEEAQKEQVAWREIQQQLAAQRGSLTPDQIRAKERDLQARITETQRRFRERNRVIQEAVQYSLAQIERTLSGVLQQIAASRGMNMILHRAQVALNVAEFDVSGQAVAELNKILPSVMIPPDGVSPSAMPPVTQAVPAPPPVVTSDAPVPRPSAAPAPATSPPAAVPAPGASATAPTGAKPKH